MRKKIAIIQFPGSNCERETKRAFELSTHQVDIIRWNDEGKIIDFKVMIRPLQAIGALQKKMSEALDNLSQ